MKTVCMLCIFAMIMIAALAFTGAPGASAALLFVYSCPLCGAPIDDLGDCADRCDDLDVSSDEQATMHDRRYDRNEDDDQ